MAQTHRLKGSRLQAKPVPVRTLKIVLWVHRISILAYVMRAALSIGPNDIFEPLRGCGFILDPLGELDHPDPFAFTSSGSF